MEDNHYTEIDQYLQGVLSTEQRKAFESRLKNDADFASEVNLYQEIEQSLASRISNKEAEKELRNTLQQLQKEQFVSEKKPTKVIQLNRFRKYMIAASIAALIGLFVFNQGTTPTYEAFANHQNIELTVRGASNTKMQNAEEAFNNKDYITAIEYLDQVLAMQPTNIEIQLYKAIALLETNQFLEADNLLESISTEQSIFKNKATWYYALSMLKQSKLDACKNILKRLPKDAEDYNSAQKLLKKL